MSDDATKELERAAHEFVDRVCKVTNKKVKKTLSKGFHQMRKLDEESLMEKMRRKVRAFWL